MSKLIRVLRIEGPDGQGPYSFRFQSLAFGKARNHADTMMKSHGHWPIGREDPHPSPSADRGIDRYPEHDEVCAFASLAQLVAWFTPADLKHLMASGFKLRAYFLPAEAATIGNCQTLIDRTTAITYPNGA